MTRPLHPASIWKLRTISLSLEKPVFMGIVNITPDSFSDGGRFFNIERAVEHARRLVADGAGILDIGGESTRPGSDGVDTDEELRRVVPVIQILANDARTSTVPISVDTIKPVVAGAAIQAGAEIINDVSETTSPEMLRVLLRTGAAYCLMHSQGSPKTMQIAPQYDNVVEEVFEILHHRRDELITAGIDPLHIALDPGLGFGKTIEHNWALIDNIERFHALQSPLLVGHSRKRFIAETFEDRESGTRIVTRKLLDHHVQIIRLHEIR